MWAKFDESNAAKEWVHAAIMKNKVTLYKVGRGLVSRRLGANTVYTLEGRPSSERIDLIPLMNAVSSYEPENFNQDELKLFTAILEGGLKILHIEESQSSTR